MEDDDSQNWSLLRQRIEGYRILEDLRKNGPRLTLPESLVRQALATQYNCRPDEITFEQIGEELSLILQIYPTISVEPDNEFFTNPPAPESSSPQKGGRFAATIDCPAAARKMEAHIQAKGIGLTTFAIQAQTTDRTLRRFRKTGQVRRDIFENIAKTMGLTKEELLNS